MAEGMNRQQDGQTNLRGEVLSIGKHSSVYFIGQALSRAVGFFMIPIYTRFIAPTNYGAMEIIEILAGIVSMIITMGVADGMSRFYYAEKDQTKRNQIVSTIIIGFGGLGIPIVSFFLMFSGYISVGVLDGIEYRYYLQIAIATVWFGMLCEIGYTFMMMMYMAKQFVIVTSVQLVMALSLNIWFVVFLKLNILGIFYSTLITEALTGIFLSVAIVKKVGLKFSKATLLRLMKFGLPLVPGRVGFMLGFVSNRFFLRWFTSPDPAIAFAQVGLFSLGHKFGVVINRFVNAPFNSFWGPRRLELALSDAPDSKEIISKVCTYATLCSIYASLLLSSGIENLIEIIADPAYNGAHQVVPLIAVAYVALGLETHFSTGLLYKKKTIWSTYTSVISFCVILLWNYIFVPKYGLLGAATANLVGFTVRCVIIYSVSQRFYPIPFELKRIGTIFAMSCVLYLLSRAIRLSSPYTTFVARVGLASLFPFTLCVIRFYSNSEMEFAGQVLQKAFRTIGRQYLHLRRVR